MPSGKKDPPPQPARDPTPTPSLLGEDNDARVQEAWTLASSAHEATVALDKKFDQLSAKLDQYFMSHTAVPPQGTKAPAGQHTLPSYAAAANAQANRTKRDAIAAILRIPPFYGRLDDDDIRGWTTPSDLILQVEQIIHHQYPDANISEQEVIGHVASRFEGDARSWWNVRFAKHGTDPVCTNWAAFRMSFLREFEDAHLSSKAVDALVGDNRVRMQSFTGDGYKAFDTVFRRQLNHLDLSCTMGHPNATGPPNDKWITAIFYNGLHPSLRAVLGRERSTLDSFDKLRARVQELVDAQLHEDDGQGPPPTQYRQAASLAADPGVSSELCNHPDHRGRVSHTWATCRLNPVNNGPAARAISTAAPRLTARPRAPSESPFGGTPQALSAAPTQSDYVSHESHEDWWDRGRALGYWPATLNDAPASGRFDLLGRDPVLLVPESSQ